MNDSAKTVTKVADFDSSHTPTKSRISQKELRSDYNYCSAQKLIKLMLENKLISVDEFNKISEKNRQTFSPYLAEIMP